MGQGSRWCWLWGGVLLLAGSSEAVRLKYQGKPGDRFVYGVGLAIHTAMESGTQRITLPARVTLRIVVEVLKAEEKSLTLRYKVEKARMEVGGQATPLGLPPSMVVTMQRNGKVTRVEREDEGKPAPAIPTSLQPSLADVATQLFLVFPEKDLRPGDSWSHQGEAITPFGGSVNLRGKSTFLGEEEIGGRRCAKIRTEFTVPFSLPIKFFPDQASQGTMKGTLRGTATTYFDLQVGHLARSSTEARSDTVMAAPPGPSGQQVSVKAAANVRSTIQRLSEGNR